MARSKVTVTLDRGKVQEAIELIGGKSMSAVLDVALDKLIHDERLKRDIAAYAAMPPTDDEVALAEMGVELDLDDDDVDYGQLYGNGR